MTDFVDRRRRLILGVALSGVAAKAFAQAEAPAPPVRAPSSKRLEPLRQIDAGVLKIAYYEEGPADGPVAVLLHGFPYDIHSSTSRRNSPRKVAASSFPICAASARRAFAIRRPRARANRRRSAPMFWR